MCFPAPITSQKVKGETKMKQKINMILVVIFIALSIFDLLANGGAILVPVFGGMTETVQELVNEMLQIAILGYFALLMKR